MILKHMYRIRHTGQLSPAILPWADEMNTDNGHDHCSCCITTPVSASSITWYWSQGGDALRMERSDNGYDHCSYWDKNGEFCITVDSVTILT